MARKPPSKTARTKPTRKATGKTPKGSRGNTPLGIPAPDPDPILPGVNPAADEHATPATSLPFPIAAIGASAGGLDAYGQLLGALPVKTGMAFVLIQHLSPSHPSVLSDILARSTGIPVTQVEDQMPVEPDHVYVIPPGKTMVLGDGVLQLSPRTEIRGQARPIDHFMRSLAEEHGHKGIGVVLSGTGNDGTLGIEEIKAAGGITFAQDNTAEHTGMPRSAIATGAVDHVLPPRAIAEELARIASHPYLSPAVEQGRIELSPSDLQRVLDQLRARSGVDFSQYKRNTLYRRIARRMLLSKLDRGPEYLALLEHDPAEADALYQDVLINVTSFFRNPEAYEALKTQVFARLTEGRGRQDQVRVWALGCSTGEEAYSLAIAFTEFLEETGRRVPLQVFATDLNGAGIERARAGIYGKGIVQDVSPERLRRHFVEIDGSYRIARPIRDMCVFARQNVLSDPPFSRLDLVACRNMLIYLEPALQQKLIPLLHYALRPEGYLWLGGSETIGGYRDLFEPLDAKSRIYTKKGTGSPASFHTLLPRLSTHAAPKAVGSARAPELDPHREADRVLLSRYAPPAVVLNESQEILQFRGDTSPFLRPAPGKASLNLLKMLREGLLVAVRGALARAEREQSPVREAGLRVRSDGGWTPVEVVVVPLKGQAEGVGSTLVMFEEATHSIEARARQMDTDAKAALAAVPENDAGGEIEVMRLKQEIGATRDYLQSVIEQQEAVNEELQSANEEVQSANEELQSVNEELETSKEEIQSANEELATVNEELQSRNAQLTESNNDLTNLISSVQMAIVMLGPDLRIRRFTPPAEKLLNLIPADVGRPIGDIKLNLSIDNLEQIALEVIETVSPRELEVQLRNEHWYSLRVRPYRTIENRIDGAVVVLVDIDNLKKADRAVRESERRFELLADSAPVLIWMNDLEGCRFVNRAFEEFVGVLEVDIRSSEPGRFVHPGDRTAYLDAYAEAVQRRKPFEARMRMRRADGEYRWMKAMALPRYLADRQVIGYVGCTVDITDMKEAEAALIELDRGKNEFLAMLAHELRNPLAGVRNAAHLLGAGGDDATVEHARVVIERQTAHMARMVDDLLDVSRVTHGKIHLRLSTVDVAAAARHAIEATEHAREERSQTLTHSIPEEPLRVRGDAMRLDQIICNLLDNASKFTRHGGRIWVTVERESAPGAEAPRARAVIRVRDNGVGIDRTALPRIFDLFVQDARGSERSRGGIGLGLTLAKRLVELHGGTIEAFSAGNALGSEFVVRLPLASDEFAPEDVQAKQSPARTKAKPRRILVVDDNRDAAEAQGLALELAGHLVRVVGDGAAAERAMAEFIPDVVLLDIGLPDMDGYRVARDIRAMPRGAEALIVAITGYGREEDVRMSQQAGIDEHLTKPVDPAVLGELLARARKKRPR